MSNLPPMTQRQYRVLLLVAGAVGLCALMAVIAAVLWLVNNVQIVRVLHG